MLYKSIIAAGLLIGSSSIALGSAQIAQAAQKAAALGLPPQVGKTLGSAAKVEEYHKAKQANPSLTPEAFLSGGSSGGYGAPDPALQAELEKMKKQLREAEEKAKAASAAADPAMAKRIKDLEEMLAAERARKTAGGSQMPEGVDQTDVEARESKIKEAQALYEKLSADKGGLGDEKRLDDLFKEISKLEDKLGLVGDARFVKSTRTQEDIDAEKSKKDRQAEDAKRAAQQAARLAEDQAAYAGLMAQSPDAAKYPNAQVLKDLVNTHVNKSPADLDRAAADVKTKATPDEGRALRYAFKDFGKVAKYNTLVANIDQVIQGSPSPAAAAAGASSATSDQGIFEAIKVSDPAFFARLEGLRALSYPQKIAMADEVANWTADQQKAFMWATRKGTDNFIPFEKARKAIEGILKGKPAASSSSSAGAPPKAPPPPAPAPAPGAAPAGAGAKTKVTELELLVQGLQALGIPEPTPGMRMKAGKGAAWKALMKSNPNPTANQMKTALQTDGLYNKQD